jgi:diguanylate cyclase (GGDEF)-like protein
LDYHCRLIRRDGETRVVHVLGECVTDPSGVLQRMFGTVHDVTERKLLQDEIEHLAFHDPLTGLANRRLFLDRLGQALAEQRSGRRCAVLFLDLDDFKSTNDTLGHKAGDALLCEVAKRLKRAVRAGDTVARFGGDEFALLCEDADLQAATRTAERIEAELDRPVRVHDIDIPLRASIGIALSEGSRRADDILRDADAAMYAAKAQRKNSHAAFPSEASLWGPAARTRRDEAIHHSQLSGHQQALIAGQQQPCLDLPALRIALQPIVDLDTGQLVAVEALSRFEGCSPLEAFEQARRAGVGPALEAHAIRAALAHRGADRLLCLNVSLPALLTQVVADALPNDLSKIVLEITEHSDVGDSPTWCSKWE